MLDSSQNQEFVRLWTLHGRQVYTYLMALMPNRADVDDLYQDVAMTLWDKFGQFDPKRSFLAWARGIALNKVRNFKQLRRHNTMLCSSKFLESVHTTISSRAEVLDAQSRVLANCLDKLPSRHKALIEQRYNAGATPAMLATQLGRSLSAIYKALGRIHDTLFDCVRESTFGEKAS